MEEWTSGRVKAPEPHSLFGVRPELLLHLHQERVGVFVFGISPEIQFSALGLLLERLELHQPVSLERSH